MKVIERQGQEMVDIEKCYAEADQPKDQDGRPIKYPPVWTIEEQVLVEGETGDVLTVGPDERDASNPLKVAVGSGAPGVGTLVLTFGDVLQERAKITNRYSEPGEANMRVSAPVPEV